MLDKHILRFNKTIKGLRDFVSVIEPLLLEKHKTVEQEHKTFVEPIMSLGLINSIIENQKDKVSDDELANLYQKKEELNSRLTTLYPDTEINATFNIDENSKIKSEKSNTLKGGWSIKASKPLGIDDIISKHKQTSELINLLYENGFISLINSSEWFFSQILHYYYNSHPQSAGISKMSMTLDDLKNFQSVKDAENFLIENKVEEILRGSFDKWVKTLKDDLGLSMGYMTDINHFLIEIYQRRNIIVHNGGIVNNIYLSKVSDKLKKNVSVGDKLIITNEYLEDAICKLQLTYLLIAAELWKKLETENKDRANILTDIVYENLLLKRWDISEGLSYFIKGDAKMEPIDKTIAELNYWLCKKRKGEFDKIKKEIDSANYSDKKEILQLGLAGLREDKDTFFNLLPIVLKGENLDIEKLQEFPIFEEMRQTKEYEDFIAQNQIDE